MAKQKKGGGGGGGGKKKGAKSGKISAPPAAGAGDDGAAPATGGVVGLTNLGNTCFFNSVLQVLASAPLVRDHYGAPAASTSGGPLGRALSTTVGALTGRAPGGAGPDKRGARTHSPAGLLAAVVKIAPQFRGRAQQDAHELLRLLLDGVRGEEDGKSAAASGDNKKKKAAPVSLAPPSASASYAERVFGGQLASRLACACGDASTSLEPFMDLSLPVPAVVVENGAAKTDAPTTKPPKKPAAALTAKQAKRAAKAAKQKEKAAKAKEAEKEEQVEADAAAAAPSVATDSPTTDASSLSSAPRPETPAIDVPVGGAAGTAAVPDATLPPPPPPPPPPSDPFAAAGSPDAGCELGEETPVVSPVLLAPVMVNPPTSTSPPPAADAPAVPPPPDTYDDMDRTLYADPGAAAADADAVDASPPATPGSSRGADAGSSSSSSSPSSSRASSPDMAGLGGLFDGVKIDDGAAPTPARATPSLAFADDTVAPGADLAACLAAFFAAESVEWTCPTKEKEKEAASASRLPSPSPSSSSPPSTPPPNVRPLSMRRSVSFCEAGPSVHVVPGSAEQRGTDFEEAARGRAAFRRPLRADGVCLLVTAEADAATRDKVHVALHPYDDDADAVARVLPQAVAVASVPIDRVEDSDDEAEQARLRGGCQALMDCVADMVAHGGVPNMERMADGGLDLARDATGAWRVSGVSPAGPWSWPAGAAVLSPSPSPSQRGFHKPSFTGPGSPQVRGGGGLVAAAAAKAKKAAADAAADDAKHTACTKRYAIHAAPPLLTLHLKRFGRDARGRLRKLGGHVAFPLDVTLGAVAPPGALPDDVAARRYSLHGVVEHMGSMRGGHYVAYVRRDAAVKKKKKKGDGNEDGAAASTTTTSWYRASDSHVAGVSEADVLGCEAYILLYGRVEEEDAGRE